MATVRTTGERIIGISMPQIVGRTVNGDPVYSMTRRETVANLYAVDDDELSASDALQRAHAVGLR